MTAAECAELNGKTTGATTGTGLCRIALEGCDYANFVASSNTCNQACLGG